MAKSSSAFAKFKAFLRASLGLPARKDEPHLRYNYEDPSLKFSDWVSHLGPENARWVLWMDRLESRFRLRRLLFIFVFSFVLSYVLFYDVNDTRNFRPGQVAIRTVQAPMSFTMEDKIATEKQRDKMEQAVPFVFDFLNDAFNSEVAKVYRGFREMREMLKAANPPKLGLAREDFNKDFLRHRELFNDILGTEVSEYVFEWLVSQNFNARIENAVIKNLEAWYSQKVAESPEKLLEPQEHSLTLREKSAKSTGEDIKVDRETVLDISQVQAQKVIAVEIADWQDRDRKAFESLMRVLFKPNLIPNFEETKLRKQNARDAVHPVMVTFEKKQSIVDEGKLVQPEHIQVFEELQRLRGGQQKDILAWFAALLFVTLIVVFFSYLKRFSLNKVKVEAKDLVVMASVTLFVVIMTKVFLFMTDAAFVNKFSSIFSSDSFLYLAPVAAGPMLVGLVIQSGEVVWLFTAFLSIALGVMVDMNFVYMIVTFVGGIAAARGVHGCKTRNDIYLAGVRTGLVNALMIGLVMVVSKLQYADFWRETMMSIPAGFLGGIFSAMVTMMVIPFIESLFNYTTDVKLLELSNLNHPLLKQMIVSAPGTYHHSMMVGSMVEAAAEEIGANPLLAKVMAYYHDIGKMAHSNYFIENQKAGNNPHDHISPFMSKTLLIAHVKDGVELGIQHKLGKPIIDGVVQHHGTTLISYFYNKALDLKDEDSSEFDEEEFRYPGPKPQFREAALCMLADSIEAAARSLDEPTPVRLQNIVKNIIQRKFMDGQLDECNLTLKDLSRVEDAFIRILLGIYHQRIDYPRNMGGGASESPTTSFKGPN